MGTSTEDKNQDSGLPRGLKILFLLMIVPPLVGLSVWLRAWYRHRTLDEATHVQAVRGSVLGRPLDPAIGHPGGAASSSSSSASSPGGEASLLEAKRLREAEREKELERSRNREYERQERDRREEKERSEAQEP